jgi:hypothetical protein
VNGKGVKMKSTTLVGLVLATFNLEAATLYVSLQSTNPVSPYATWETAATVIQDAVDLAKDGDTVLVGDGVYDVGGATDEWGRVDSRVTITNAVRLESVNGPSKTTIDGGWDGLIPSTNGIRCVYLGPQAVLSGFTLTNGLATLQGGGVFCISGSAVVTNCTISGNGAAGDYFYRPSSGGGAYGVTLYDCVLAQNSASSWSGRNRPNWGPFYPSGRGGGAANCTLFNCVLSGNSANAAGGGCYGCTVHNCTLTGNSAISIGSGGATESALYNCTVTGNIGAVSGGVQGSTLFNCIIVGNTNGNYSGETTLNFCLTSPLPTNGIGNIDADPRFVNAAAGDFRLRPDSPCIDAGTNLLSLIQTDITGEVRPWDGNKDGVAAFDIGAYEFRPSPVTLYVSVTSTNPVPPFTTWATAAKVIQDAVDIAKDGDTVLVTNGVYAVGGKEVQTEEWPWAICMSRVVITNSIKLESVNGPLVTAIVGTWVTNEFGEWVGKGVRCVYMGANAVLSGFTLTNGHVFWWGTPQWVPSVWGGGVYCDKSANGVVTNCTLIHNTASGKTDSRPRPPVPMGYGGGAANCILYNCTLTENTANGGGGGAANCILYNCTLTKNTAITGGGAYRSTLYNCTVAANRTLEGAYWGSDGGGGAHGSTLYSCILRDNSASFSGGASRSTLYNCTVTGNSSGVEGCGSVVFNSILYGNTNANYYACTTLNFCLTSPLPTNGVGNIDADPRFVNAAGGDFRLRPDSPCIDKGTNLLGFTLTTTNVYTGEIFALSYTGNATDILGYPRGGDGNGDGKAGWDMGAYEYDPTVPIITDVSVTASGLTLQWNAGAIGAKLQRATSLTQPDWQEKLGSEKTNRVVLPIWDGNEFFRLVRP